MLSNDISMPLRAKGASDSLLHVLREEGLLDGRMLEEVVSASLKATIPSPTRRSKTNASPIGKGDRRQRSKRNTAKVPPPPHAELLAAIALCYLL